VFKQLARHSQTRLAQIHRLSIEGGWIVAGQIASVIGALLLVRVLTEYLSPVQYGQLALGLTIAGLVNQVVMGGITAGIGRYYSIAVEKQDLGGYLHATRLLLAYGTAVVLVICLILMAGLYWYGYSQWIGLAAAALVLSVFSGYNGTLSSIQNAARQRVIVAFHGGLDAWLKILLAVGAMLWLGTSGTAVVIGYACSSLLVTLSQLIFLRRTIPRHLTPVQNRQTWITQIWVFSFPFTTVGAFTWMQQISDRWALQAFGTAGDVGQYAVLFQLGYTPIALIGGMAMSFISPILYQRSGDATNHSRNSDVHRISWQITNFSLVITLVGFVVTFYLHEWLFSLLVTAEYRRNSYLLPWVVLAGGVFNAGQMLCLKLLSELKSSTTIAVKIVTALICTLLNVLGAAIVGIEGIVGAMVFYSCFYFVWMAALTRRISLKA
jgi:O-antigen/teichoic acid export membrane protein